MKKLLTICFSLIFLCFSMTACTSSSASGDLVCSECETKITKNSNFCSSCGASIENEADDSEIETSGRTYNWDEVCLSSYLPEPKSEYGIVQTNSPDDLYMIVEGTSYKTYQDYVESCKEFGYDIDPNDSNGTYEAFSDDAGRLSVEYFSYDKAMHISLEILVSGTYRWQELYFAELLPAPESKSGNVHNNNDARCDLYVGDISKDSFAAYVEKCKERDFTLDSQEYEEYYFAKNPDGYELTIEYYGCDVIYIEIYDPHWEERDTVSISVNADSNTDNTDIGSVELVLENDTVDLKHSEPEESISEDEYESEEYSENGNSALVDKKIEELLSWYSYEERDSKTEDLFAYYDYMTDEQKEEALGRYLFYQEAPDKVENKIKNSLKNPSSYTLYSMEVDEVLSYHNDTNDFTGFIDVTYGGTNSFGGMEKDTVNVWVKFSIDIENKEINIFDITIWDF